MLPAEERGAGAAISVLGYRLGMLVSGGLACGWQINGWSWQGMYWLMAALLIPVLSRRCLQNPPTPFLCPKTLEQAVVAPLRDFFGRNNAAYFASYRAVYKWRRIRYEPDNHVFDSRRRVCDAGVKWAWLTKQRLAYLAHCAVGF